MVKQTILSSGIYPQQKTVILCGSQGLFTKTLHYVSCCNISAVTVGTRFFIRGLDMEGNSANYVETEQLAQFEFGVCSFVQVCSFVSTGMFSRTGMFFCTGNKNQAEIQVRFIKCDLINRNGINCTSNDFIQ